MKIRMRFCSPVANSSSERVSCTTTSFLEMSPNNLKTVICPPLTSARSGFFSCVCFPLLGYVVQCQHTAWLNSLRDSWKSTSVCSRSKLCWQQTDSTVYKLAALLSELQEEQFNACCALHPSKLRRCLKILACYNGWDCLKRKGHGLMQSFPDCGLWTTW